jgi:hypothetical protein
MKAQTKGIDQLSFELARHFLNGEDLDSLGNRWELAGEIQQAVESWFAVKQLSGGESLATLKSSLEPADGVDRLTTDQYETLVRKSKAPRWCICADPIHCDQRDPVVCACRAKALGFPILSSTKERT